MLTHTRTYAHMQMRKRTHTPRVTSVHGHAHAPARPVACAPDAENADGAPSWPAYSCPSPERRRADVALAARRPTLPPPPPLSRRLKLRPPPEEKRLSTRPMDLRRHCMCSRGGSWVIFMRLPDRLTKPAMLKTQHMHMWLQSSWMMASRADLNTEKEPTELMRRMHFVRVIMACWREVGISIDTSTADFDRFRMHVHGGAPGRCPLANFRWGLNVHTKLEGLLGWGRARPLLWHTPRVSPWSHPQEKLALVWAP